MKPQNSLIRNIPNQQVIIGLTLIILLVSPFTSSLWSKSSYVHETPLTVNHVSLSADVPSLNLTYTTRTLSTAAPVHSGDVIAGDHVTLKTEWKPAVNNSRLEVHAPAIPSTLIMDENQSTLEMDTRSLGNNATCTIIASTQLANGTVWSFEFIDVYIGNFFMPIVKVISPNGGENWTSLHNITWTATDGNADDSLLFDVMYSDDSGVSYELLVESTNKTWFEWDCSGLDMGNYTVKVRATDGIYYSYDQSDAEFSAGTVPTTTPTTTTTTTPTPTDPGIESRALAFVAILLFSSAIMALVVYYAARKWF